MPLAPAASALASRLLTVKVELPLMSRVVLTASASAFTVIVSPDPLALMVVAPLPVVTLMALSVASAVVTARVPEVPAANTEPLRLVTVKSLVLALPVRVRLLPSPRLVALTVRS